MSEGVTRTDGILRSGLHMEKHILGSDSEVPINVVSVSSSYFSMRVQMLLLFWRGVLYVLQNDR